jgi:hypothetical protein
MDERMAQVQVIRPINSKQNHAIGSVSRLPSSLAA